MQRAMAVDAVFAAAGRQDWDAVHAALDAGVVDVRTAQPGSGWRLLHWAGHHNHAHTAARLLGLGADPNARASAGCTPLHYCAVEGGAELLHGLVQAGGDVNALDNNQWTPLVYAAVHNKRWLGPLKYLLSLPATHVDPDHGACDAVSFARDFEWGEAAAAIEAEVRMCWFPHPASQPGARPHAHAHLFAPSQR